MDRLLIAVLGNRNAGKSRTWNTLFGRRVRSGKKEHVLEVAPNIFVDVFLVSGSPEERKEYVGDILAGARARVVLCSVQYLFEARETFDYFIRKHFSLYVQWINPGYCDRAQTPDSVGLVSYLLHNQAIVSIRDGTVSPRPRVRELCDFIHGWVDSRGLTYES